MPSLLMHLVPLCNLQPNIGMLGDDAKNGLQSMTSSELMTRCLHVYDDIVDFMLAIYGRVCGLKASEFMVLLSRVFLEYSSGWRPQVGLFVVRDCALRSVLLKLYPLLRHFLIRHHLPSEMVEERFIGDEVRSSELDTSLSSSDDPVDIKEDMVTSKPSTSSLSTPFQALIKECVLEEKHLKNLRKCFQFPTEMKMCLPRPGEKACAFAHGHVCFYEADFLCGLHFPIHPIIHELLDHLKIAHGQLVPNAWRMVVVESSSKLEEATFGMGSSSFGLLSSYEDFNKLVDPQFLYDHCLGPKPLAYVQRLLLRAERSMATCFSHDRYACAMEKKNQPLSEISTSLAKRLKAESSLCKLKSCLLHLGLAKERRRRALSSVPSHELVNHHIHKLVQVLGESLRLMTDYLAMEEKAAMTNSRAETTEAEGSRLRKDLVKAMN
ncbi:hypothetical protein SO802_006049 [Lithocarpus litseifolius]|uniref:Uncharacterized protein n=1 Tax=Lithocarpus litseifolius TaxID=425828 RepID=A0AAW2DQE1_9ROSI